MYGVVIAAVNSPGGFARISFAVLISAVYAREINYKLLTVSSVYMASITVYALSQFVH